MVATKCDNTGMMFSVGRDWDKRLTSKRIIAKGGESRPVEELFVPTFNLMDSKFVVIRCDWNVTTIYDF